MNELPKRITITEETPRQAGSDYLVVETSEPWATPEAKDLTVTGDEHQITRNSNALYTENKAVRTRFDEEERQAEIDDLEEMYKLPATKDPQLVKKYDEIGDILNNWSMPFNENLRPRIPKIRRFARNLLKIVNK